MVDTTGNGREAWWSRSRPRRTMGMSCKRRVWSQRREIIGKRFIVSSALHLFSEFIVLKGNWSLSSSSCEHQYPLWSKALFSLWPTSSWNSQDHKVHPLLRSLLLKPSVSGMDMSWPCLCNYKCPWTSGQAWYSCHTRRKKKTMGTGDVGQPISTLALVPWLPNWTMSHPGRLPWTQGLPWDISYFQGKHRHI